MSKDTFTYQGRILLRLSDGSTEVYLKNTRTENLGRTICKALAGYNVSDNIPKFLDFQEQNNTKWISLLNRKIPFTGIIYESPTEAENSLMSTLKLNSVILYQDKKLDKILESSTIRVAMYDNENNLLAYAVTLNNISNEHNLASVFNQITPGVDCVLKWNMEFHVENEEISTEDRTKE